MFSTSRFQPVSGSYNPANGLRASIIMVERPARGNFPEHSMMEGHLIYVSQKERALYYCLECYHLDEGLMTFASSLDADGDRVPNPVHPMMMVQAEDGDPFARFILRIPQQLIAAATIDSEQGNKEQLAFPCSFFYQLWLPESVSDNNPNAAPMAVSALIGVTAYELWRERVARIMTELVDGKCSALMESMNDYLAEKGVDKGDTSDEAEKARHIAVLTAHGSVMAELLETDTLKCMSVLSVSTASLEGNYLPFHSYASVMVDAMRGNPIMGANSFIGNLVYHEMRRDNDDLSAEEVYGMGELELSDLLAQLPGGEDVEISDNPSQTIEQLNTLLTANFHSMDMEDKQQRELYIKLSDELRRLKSFSEVVPSMLVKGANSNLVEQWASIQARGVFPEPNNGRVVTSCTYQLMDVRQLVIECGSRDPDDVADYVVEQYRATRADYESTVESMMKDANLSGQSTLGDDIMDTGDTDAIEESIRSGIREAMHHLLEEGETENDDAFRDLMAGLF
jgi:hypothetical protein